MSAMFTTWSLKMLVKSAQLTRKSSYEQLGEISTYMHIPLGEQNMPTCAECKTVHIYYMYIHI